MATASRIRFEWFGTTIDGGGVSTFYSANSDPSALSTAIRTFFSVALAYLPLGTVISPPSGGDTFESTTGILNGAWSMTPGAALTSSAGGQYAKGVGMRVKWNTTGITRGRRVRGTTFLVPLVAGLYDSNGTIADTTITALQTAADTLIAADGGSMRVYSRPSGAGATDGALHAVTSAQVVDQVSWLRSRRT